MLPRELYAATGIEAFGVTRPANTVGGDLYDVIRRPDGRIVFALGDVAGKGSPAALLMALVVAMLRALVDEGLEPEELANRLNVQVSRHAPGIAVRDDGRWVPTIRDSGEPDVRERGPEPAGAPARVGQFEKLTEGGMALGMFEQCDLHAGLAHAGRRRRAGALQRWRHRSGEPLGRRLRRSGAAARDRAALVAGPEHARHVGPAGRRSACLGRKNRRRPHRPCGATPGAAAGGDVGRPCHLRPLRALIRPDRRGVGGKVVAARDPPMPLAAKGLRRHAAVLVLLAGVAALGDRGAMGAAVLRAQQGDGVRVLLSKVEAALGAGNRADFLAVSTLDPADGDVSAFLDRWFTPRTTRAVIAERDRQTMPDGGLRLVLEALTEAGNTGRLGTWILEIAPVPDGWRVRKVTASNPVEGLYRLELNATKQFHAKDLVVKAEDLELRLPAGEVFVAEAGGGTQRPCSSVAARWSFIRRPRPNGARSRSTAAAMSSGRRSRPRSSASAPVTHGQTLPAEQLSPRPSSRRSSPARERCSTKVSPSRSPSISADLSRDSWSLLPTTGDFLAEIATSKFGTLTYAHASNDEEDISLFDRLHKRNISVYTSAARLATRGPSLQRRRRRRIRRAGLPGGQHLPAGPQLDGGAHQADREGPRVRAQRADDSPGRVAGRPVGRRARSSAGCSPCASAGRTASS